MGKDDLQMSYLFVIISVKISLCFHSVGVFQSVLKYIHPFWGDYILVSALAFLPDTPLLWVCLEHFISPMRAVHGKHRVMERRGEKASLQKKKSKTKWEDFFFFWSSFPVCWHELKAHCPALTKKMESSLIRKKEKEKKKNQKCPRLLAHLSAWQIGEVTVAVFGIFEIRHKKKKRKKKMV